MPINWTRYILILLCLCAAVTASAQERSPYEQRIHDVNAIIQKRRASKVLGNKDLYDKLTDTAQFKLPYGIGGGNNGNPPVIIDSIRFLPDHAEITAYIVIPIPGSSRELMFAASGIPVSRSGGLVGTARLELVNDQPFNPFGNDAEFKFLHGKTFVEFDCNGFKRLGIGAEVKLPSKLLPVGADGKPRIGERVKGTFEVATADISDILAAVNIESFQISGLPGVTFNIQDAILDMSDANNAPGMTFPKEYTEDDRSLWRGFFLRKFEVQLPPELKNRATGKSASFMVRNALIDDKGFSGDLSAINLIPMKDGDLGGWSYSLDTVGISLVANQLKGGEIGGGINIPITKETTRFGYSAIFHPGDEYVFTIAPADTVDVPIFIGQAHLLKSSSLEVTVKDGKFRAMAVLNGTLSIDGGKYGDVIGSFAKKFNIPQIKFEQLTVSTESPYFHAGTFSFAAGGKLPSFAGYGFSVTDINLVKDGEKRGLQFNVRINVSGTGENGFAADASLALMGKVEKDEQGRIHHLFSELRVSKVGLDVNQGVFKLHGSLEFFTDHDIYGNGFRGDLNASLKICSGTVTLGATALFGNVKGDRYWYADIMVDLPVPITIIPPVISMKGFGGALFYGVSVLGKGMDTSAYRLGAASGFGSNPTHIFYKPDPASGLGIKASLKFIAGQEKTLNGMVGLEIAFNRAGGLRRINFRGELNVMSLGLTPGTASMLQNIARMMPPGQGADSPAGDCGYDPDAFNPSGLISAGLKVDVDFENSTMLANLKVYIDVYGAFTGTGPNKLAGEGEFYVGPEGWHLFAGTPDNPIGVSILGLAKAHAYFMVGNGLPGSPPPPPIVSEILGGLDLDYMRDMNSLGKGSGFAFGAGLDFDTGDKSFLMFYARLRAGIGFDIMMKNYGDAFHCEGKTGPIGINGWFANGQVYGYFQGKIGINVKLPFKKGKFDIIELGAATVLQAKVPNPAWMRGIVGGYFKLFGGLIKGNCKFELTLGEECKIVSNNLFAEAGVQIIADATPKDQDADQSVFTLPQVVMNMPVGDIININGDDGVNHKFRTRLEYLTLRRGAANVDGSWDWNGDNTVVVLNTAQCLEPNSAYKLSARVTFEENVNGSWTPYLVDGKPYAEELNNTFQTGKLPDVIPENIIRYTYPLRKQLNYYKDEVPGHSGYIIFTKDIAPMFRPDSSFTQTARLIPFDGGAPIDMPFSYTSGKVNFKIPDGVKNDATYTFALVNVPVENETDISRNVKSTTTEVGNEASGSISVTTKTATRSITAGSEKAFYQLDFRSSKYNTFSDKLNGMGVPSAYRYPLRNGVHELGNQYESKELFDNAEVDADGNSQLLKFEAVLDDNAWFQQDISPYLYVGYPFKSLATAQPLTISWRIPEQFGVPPVRAIYIRQQQTGMVLIPDAPTQYTGPSSFVYNLPNYIERDYIEIMNKMANNIYGRQMDYTAEQKRILMMPFTPVRKGDYKFRIQYILPGTDLKTSERIITIQNPFGL